MGTPAAIDLSVVIPVYHAAPTLVELTERLLGVLNAIGLRYEVIFVDDGSGDTSWSVLLALQHAHPGRIMAIRLMRNYGQHNATMCGLRQARGRYLITMDDDLQNPPEEIPKLLDAIQTLDLDLVYGRYKDKRHGNWRNLGSALVNALWRLAFHSRVNLTSFRVIRRELVDAILHYSPSFTIIDGLLAWNTQRIGEVTVAHHPRCRGRSGYSPVKLVVLALNLFTTFSLLPLRIVSAGGLAAAGIGLMAGTYHLVQHIHAGADVSGSGPVLAAVLLLGGFQLMALGIVGEYLGRLHANASHKPQYAIREAVGQMASAYPHLAGEAGQHRRAG
jgi:undecaprenyl-phosphate 4-deoxy-4-formamido-L-arabinose transferase